MKKTIALLLAGSFGLLSEVSAITLMPIQENDLEQTTTITHRLHNTHEQISNTFLSNELVQLQFQLKVDENDVGQAGSLFLVAQYQEEWYQRITTGAWVRWNSQASDLIALEHKTLKEIEIIEAFSKRNLPAGEFLVYAGYLTERDQQLIYNSEPASLIVFDESAPALHQVKNKALLASFFARGTAGNINKFAEAAALDMVSGSISTIASTAAEAVSQTNLQEQGVDEGDRIKVDGNRLYALENCDEDKQKQCITSYNISAQPASNTQLGQVNLELATGSVGSLYQSTINGDKYLIYLGDSMMAPLFEAWTRPYLWQNNNTEVKFINVSDPNNMSMETHISLDTALISSRLVDGVLYLVMRKNPYFNQVFTSAIFEPALTTFAVDTRPAKAPLPKQEKLTIDDLLPTISFNDGAEKKAVVSATDCYIPSQNSSKPVDNTLVTITAIPLDKPNAYYSTCVTGSVDTFYMSTEALYLATSRYPYTIFDNGITYSNQFEMSTEIHKFSLGKETLDYRGSGTVSGHLGWEIDKQSFRMGEHEGVLKVATSKGDNWNGNSTTRVSVLKEADDKKSLEEIGFLDNLGKPGERLYAARFIGNRGYLVTFRVTDPLYVLDFSEPTQPEILGELEINGYSDYLHPVGENYLLGIGKDSIADDSRQGAWYQGVKLSLFDVSNGQNLHEVDSLIVGKRGTTSAVLSDHHALAWLAKGDSATLSIPVQLHDKENSQYGQDYSLPSANYDWTHTGLYTFAINTGDKPSIKLKHRLVTNETINECINESLEICYNNDLSTFNDRAVIQGDSVHYIHHNKVISSEITDILE